MNFWTQWEMNIAGKKYLPFRSNYLKEKTKYCRFLKKWPKKKIISSLWELNVLMIFQCWNILSLSGNGKLHVAMIFPTQMTPYKNFFLTWKKFRMVPFLKKTTL